MGGSIAVPDLLHFIGEICQLGGTVRIGGRDGFQRAGQIIGLQQEGLGGTGRGIFSKIFDLRLHFVGHRGKNQLNGAVSHDGDVAAFHHSLQGLHRTDDHLHIIQCVAQGVQQRFVFGQLGFACFQLRSPFIQLGLGIHQLQGGGQ